MDDNVDDDFLKSIPSPKRRCIPPLPADDWDNDEIDDIIRNYSAEDPNGGVPPLPADDWNNDGMDDIIRNCSAENQVGGGFVLVPVENVPPEVDQPPPAVVQNAPPEAPAAVVELRLSERISLWVVPRDVKTSTLERSVYTCRKASSVLKLEVI